MLRLKIPSRLPLRVAQINKFHNASPRAQQSIFTRYPTRKDSLYDHKNEKDSCGVGLVAHMKKLPSRQIVLDANEMLVRMSHRGACGCEINSGDGAGILVGMPDSFYRRVVKETIGKELGPLNSYGTGIIFTPKADDSVNAIKEIFTNHCSMRGLEVIGWRSIQTDNSAIGILTHSPTYPPTHSLTYSLTYLPTYPLT